VVLSRRAASVVDTTSDKLEKISPVTFLLETGKTEKEKESLFRTSTVAHPELGSLLEEVLGAQRMAERIVGDSAALRDAAHAIVEHSRALGSPIVWPVGEAANRLAGAATLLGAGDVRTRGWTDELNGECVLLLAVADVTLLALRQAARHACELGAVEVHGCRVALGGLGDGVGGAAFDSYCTVTVAEHGVRAPS
jgi:hypothetical protein